MWLEIGKATIETLYMVAASGILAILFGLPLGVLLYYAQPNKPCANTPLYQFLSLAVNIGRSVPYIILMIALIPFTRLIVGSSIGNLAAIVPLTISAIPFYARLTETAFSELPAGLTELAASLGASHTQSLTQILLPEARPALTAGATLMLINLVGYSAMAGTVGGGGLGSLAIHYGYQRFDVTVMCLTVLILVVIVQLLQALGDWGVKRLQK